MRSAAASARNTSSPSGATRLCSKSSRLDRTAGVRVVEGPGHQVHVQVGHPVAQVEPVHLGGPVALLDGPGHPRHLGPEAGGLLGRQLVGLRDVTALPDDVGVARAHRVTAQDGIGPVAHEEPRPERGQVLLGPCTHGTADAGPQVGEGLGPPVLHGGQSCNRTAGRPRPAVPSAVGWCRLRPTGRRGSWPCACPRTSRRPIRSCTSSRSLDGPPAATPMLARARRPRTTTFETASLMRAAMTAPSSQDAPTAKMANSSPPRRATMSSFLAAPAQATATLRMSSSPASWPNWSLTALSPSTSIVSDGEMMLPTACRPPIR